MCEHGLSRLRFTDDIGLTKGAGIELFQLRTRQEYRASSYDTGKSIDNSTALANSSQYYVNVKIQLNHTIIPQISVWLSFRISVCLSIYTKTVCTVHFKHDQCVARNPTTCLLYLSLYGCGQIIELNYF